MAIMFIAAYGRNPPLQRVIDRFRSARDL